MKQKNSRHSLVKPKKNDVHFNIDDEAGKQVRWLMYYLEDQGATDYFFMKGGAKAYFKGMSTDFTQSKG